MKKFLLALALINPILQADSTDSTAVPENQINEQDAAFIEFVAKFKTLHTFGIQQYAAVEQLFNECANLYSTTYNQLLFIKQSQGPDLQAKAQELTDELMKIGLELAFMLNEIKEVTSQMERFNTLIDEKATYQELTTLLLSVAQKLSDLRIYLENIQEYAKTIETQTNALKEQCILDTHS